MPRSLAVAVFATLLVISAPGFAWAQAEDDGIDRSVCPEGPRTCVRDIDIDPDDFRPSTRPDPAPEPDPVPPPPEPPKVSPGLFWRIEYAVPAAHRVRSNAASAAYRAAHPDVPARDVYHSRYDGTSFLADSFHAGTGYPSVPLLPGWVSAPLGGDRAGGHLGPLTAPSTHSSGDRVYAVDCRVSNWAGAYPSMSDFLGLDFFGTQRTGLLSEVAENADGTPYSGVSADREHWAASSSLPVPHYHDGVRHSHVWLMGDDWPGLWSHFRHHVLDRLRHWCDDPDNDETNLFRDAPGWTSLMGALPVSHGPTKTPDGDLGVLRILACVPRLRERAVTYVYPYPTMYAVADDLYPRRGECALSSQGDAGSDFDPMFSNDDYSAPPRRWRVMMLWDLRAVDGQVPWALDVRSDAMGQCAGACDFLSFPQRRSGARREPFAGTLGVPATDHYDAHWLGVR